MNINNRNIRVFYFPQQFPCGPQSSCCGPIGQSYQEVQNLKVAIEDELDSQIEVLNVMNGSHMKEHLQVLRLVRSFGPMALPVITLGEEVISMGNAAPEQIVSAIKEKLHVN